MKSYKKILTGILSILLVSIIMAGCSNVTTYPETADPAQPANVELTRLDYLAVTRLMRNHTTDVETLEKIANNILQGSLNNGSARSVLSSPSITGIRKLTSIPEKSFSSGGVNSRSVIEADEKPIEIYTFEVTDLVQEKTGYILASNDIRIGNILAIVEDGDFDDPDNPFTIPLHRYLEAYIDTTVAAYATLTEADAFLALEKFSNQDDSRALSPNFGSAQSYLEQGWYIDPIYNYESDFVVEKAPLLTTNWSKDAPYSNYLNYVFYQNGLTAKNYKHPSQVVALAQLATYYQHMNPLTPAISFFNQPTIDGWNPKVGLWTGQYNWAAMRNVSVLTEGNTALVGQIGVLMYQIRQAGTNNIINAPPSEVTFDPVTNQAYFPDLIDLIEEMGYSTGSGFTYVAYDDNTPNAVYFRTVRKFTLDAGYPYLVIGINQNMSVAHIWLVDGYGSMSTYTEKLVNPNNGQYMIITIGNPNGTLLVHCNMGLGYGNGWYIDSLFDMANMANFPDNSMGPDDALNVSSYVNWLLPLPIN